MRIETVAHASGITVCAIYPAPPGERANECRPGGRGRNNSRDNDTTVDFTVQVPGGIGLVAQTVNGSIDANGLMSDAEATTVNGEVTLQLPASINADVRALTVSGGIRSDFPLQIDTDSGPKRAEGIIGAGGQRLDISTVNGGITLLRR